MASVARAQVRDGVREALAWQGRGSDPEGAAHQHRQSPKERRIEGADEICGETQVPRRRKLRRGEPYRQIAARSEGGAGFGERRKGRGLNSQPVRPEPVEGPSFFEVKRRAALRQAKRERNLGDRKSTRLNSSH